MNNKEILKNYFGYNSFRPGQEEIISAIVNKQSCLVVLPTGGGKSLCYQVPALLANNVSIVISPLIALMKDQVDSLNKKERIAGFINSTMDFREAEEVLDSIQKKEIKLLYLAPERLEGVSFANRIKQLEPSNLFVDEAHCISEWGHNFRPSYRKIKEFADYIEVKNISAFTATATPEVVNDIVNQLGLINPKIFIKGFERNNLSIEVLRATKKKEKCLEIINKYGTPAIIYASSRKRTEEVAEFLNLYGLNAAFYHAGLASEERRHIQDYFINDKIKIIVATTAFGMGIDKKDIRLVIHYNMPATLENYYQEIGRAGRDGADSHAFLLYEDRDRDIHNYFINNSNPQKETVKEIYNAICDYSNIAIGSISQDDIAVKRDYISSYLKKDISQGIIEASLNLLQQSGYLKPVSEFEKKYTIQFNLAKEKLKQYVKTTDSNLIKDIILLLLREYGSLILNSKVAISPSILAEKFNISDESLNEILTQLYNSGIIDYKKPTPHRSVRLLLPRVADNFLSIDYKNVIRQYEQSQKKLEKIVEFVYSGECRMKFIVNYFGEVENEYRCNKCDNCKGEKNNSGNDLEYLAELFLNTITEANEGVSEQKLFSILLGKSGKEFSTYGNCSNYTQDELKTALEELISKDIIQKDTIGRKIHPGKNKKPILKKPVTQVTSPKNVEFNYEDNLELFNKLREARKAASEKFLQASYIICPDDILHKVAEVKPTTSTKLLSIKGFTQRMFNKAGNEFLEIINEHISKTKSTDVNDKNLPSNIAETYKLIEKGYSLVDIASLRKLSEAVVSMQIETILEFYPNTSIDNLFAKEECERIRNEISNGYDSLKDLKNRLPGTIGYPQIRIVVAKEKVSGA